MDRINKKKIVHVLKSSIYSGAENVVLTIINNIQDEFNFVYIATEGPIREKTRAGTCAVSSIKRI